jgi:hypothetical protein
MKFLDKIMIPFEEVDKTNWSTIQIELDDKDIKIIQNLNTSDLPIEDFLSKMLYEAFKYHEKNGTVENWLKGNKNDTAIL